MTYLKIDHELLGSTTWDLSPATRCVWITLLIRANANLNCCVRETISSLARASNVSLEEAQQAVDILSSPDPNSRSRVEQGRRIIPVAGGWKVVNLQEYRDKKSDSQWAVYKAEQRAKRLTEDKEAEHKKKVF
jgi:hypothetical protein